MHSTSLICRRVVGARGWRIGTVREIVFDESARKIEALEVGLHRPVAPEFQMRHLLARSSIDIDVGRVHAVGDHVLLSVTKLDLRQLVSSLSREPTGGSRGTIPPEPSQSRGKGRAPPLPVANPSPPLRVCEGTPFPSPRIPPSVNVGACRSGNAPGLL